MHLPLKLWSNNQFLIIKYPSVYYLQQRTFFALSTFTIDPFASKETRHGSNGSNSMPMHRKIQNNFHTNVPLQSKKRSMDELLSSPSVRRIAREHDLDLNKVTATGPKGRILKEDVLNFIKGGARKTAEKEHKAPVEAKTQPVTSATNQPSKYTDIEITQMRRIIASRLLESKTTIPHYYVSVEARIDELLRMKNQLLKIKGSKVSVNDFIIYAAAKALEEFPQCNLVLNKQTGYHEISDSIDISFAVATEKGLITPIIKKANTMSVENIAKKVKDLSERARASKLKPEEFQGGTFCISNLGMFGISHFSAVINPPQAIIVAVGGSEKKPVFNPVDLESNTGEERISLNNVDFGTFMSLTASIDRRAVDDALAAQFLNAFRRNLEFIL
jgi:pyruvate dehydrogenase complex dihydrolipoamide acetyltransferase long form